MCGVRRFPARSLGIFIVFSLISGCSFLPGFGIFEAPALYFITVGEVANQVACELQEFMSEHENDKADAEHRWVLANEDASVKLALQTDDSGYVNFTGVNVAKLGFESLARFVSTQSSVPTLAAKLSAKRTRTVQINFSVSPKALRNDPTVKKVTNLATGKQIEPNCAKTTQANNPIESLYLRDWLTNYFETINFTTKKQWDNPAGNNNLTDNFLRTVRHVASPDAIPKQFKIQSVELSTTILLAADVSGGATPHILGNGSVFILPVNGLSFDYSPDYSHKIDITLNMCDNLDTTNSCHQGESSTSFNPLLQTQCAVYAQLVPLLSGVKPPRDYEDALGVQYTCTKSGKYVRKSKTT
jgi:hypothetical protein